MKFGLSFAEYELLGKIVVEPLCAKGAVVWCFGSRARGDHQKFSDIDLMVECSEGLALLLSELKEKIEDSSFPYKVDLVEKSSFASSYLEGFERDKVIY